MLKFPSLFEAEADGFTVGQLEKIRAMIGSEVQIISQDIIQLTPLAVEPVKKRTGLIAYADGTNWDPGKGEGLYFYDSTGAWVGTF